MKDIYKNHLIKSRNQMTKLVGNLLDRMWGDK